MVNVVFRGQNGSETHIEADAGKSLMANAKENDVAGIVAECGGSMVCGTCHVHIAKPWLSRLEQPSEIEAAMLECVLHPAPEARLACQIVITEDLDGLEVIIPPSQL